MGVEVTLKREERDQLSATKTVNYCTQLLAVLHLDELIHLHVQQSSEQAKPPFFIFWYIFSDILGIPKILDIPDFLDILDRPNILDILDILDIPDI